MRQNVTLEEAQQLIIEALTALPAENVGLQEALGRIVTEDYTAPDNLPPRNQSAVDGFAVGNETQELHCTFTIKGHADLGDFPLEALGPGEAYGVLTGGILPEGTAAVIPSEMSQVSENSLTALEIIKYNNNIKQAGEDFALGEMLMSRGSQVDAGIIALLAAYGINRISVHQKPIAAILGLGSNIVPYQQIPQPGHARDVNGPMLEALINRSGGITAACEVLGDNAVASAKITQLLQQAHLLIITGGTFTLGDSFVIQQLDVLGAQSLFWGVQMMPGSHVGAFLLDNKLIISLSGNPAACAVGYHLYAAPALRAWQGINWPGNYTNAICSNGLDKKSGSRRLVRGNARITPQGWEVSVLPGQKPSMIRSLLSCNALIDVPAGTKQIHPGEQVSILLLD